MSQTMHRLFWPFSMAATHFPSGAGDRDIPRVLAETWRDVALRLRQRMEYAICSVCRQASSGPGVPDTDGNVAGGVEPVVGREPHVLGRRVGYLVEIGMQRLPGCRVVEANRVAPGDGEEFAVRSDARRSSVDVIGVDSWSMLDGQCDGVELTTSSGSPNVAKTPPGSGLEGDQPTIGPSAQT